MQMNLCVLLYFTVMLKSSDISGEHVSGQLEVFEGVEGDVSAVHHSKHHQDVSTLEGQLLDGSQVGHRAVEAETQQWETQMILLKTQADVLYPNTAVCCQRPSLILFR